MAWMRPGTHQNSSRAASSSPVRLKKPSKATRSKVRETLLGRFKGTGKEEDIQIAWEEAEGIFRDSFQRKKQGEVVVAAYPPGACAAQKTLLLVWEDKAWPGAVTEQWFHSEGSRTDAPIRFFDEAAGQERERVFAHGETVPPCKTCVLIVPYMLCPGEGGDTCQTHH